MTRTSLAQQAESITPITFAAAPAVHADSMRAVLQSGYGTTDVFHIGTTARPTPGPGEVLVRVAAARLDRGSTALGRLRRALTPTGRIAFVGNEYGGDWTAGFGRQLLALVLSPFVRQRFVILAAEERYSHFEKLATFVDRGQVVPVIDRRVPLTGLVPALHDLEAGRICGKVVIAP